MTDNTNPNQTPTPAGAGVPVYYIKTRPTEFKKFYNLLMQNAPSGYVPWFFVLEKNEKNPDGREIAFLAPKDHTCCNGAIWGTKVVDGKEAIVCSTCGEKRGSWFQSWARLDFEAAFRYLQKGFNIGIAARANDALVCMDADNSAIVKELPNTLITSTGKRKLAHGFCFTEDKRCKINIPTKNDGELRGADQYVVCAGSYVLTTEKGLQKKLEERTMTETDVMEALQDPLLGCYTVANEVPPKIITWEDIPRFYKDAQIDEKPKERQKVEFMGDASKLHPIYNITFTQIFGSISFDQRKPHPIHDSDTGQNFSISNDHHANCWRHNVTLTPVQYLAVKAEWCSCEEAGKSMKNGRIWISGRATYV